MPSLVPNWGGSTGTCSSGTTDWLRRVWFLTGVAHGYMQQWNHKLDVPGLVPNRGDPRIHLAVEPRIGCAEFGFPPAVAHGYILQGNHRLAVPSLVSNWGSSRVHTAGEPQIRCAEYASQLGWLTGTCSRETIDWLCRVWFPTGVAHGYIQQGNHR